MWYKKSAPAQVEKTAAEQIQALLAKDTLGCVGFNCPINTEVVWFFTYHNQHSTTTARAIEVFASEAEAQEARAKAVAYQAATDANWMDYKISRLDWPCKLKGVIGAIKAIVADNAGLAADTPNPLRPVTAPKAICRRSIMKRAHEIAKTLQGDRIAIMSAAMRQAWAEAKA